MLCVCIFFFRRKLKLHNEAFFSDFICCCCFFYFVQEKSGLFRVQTRQVKTFIYSLALLNTTVHLQFFFHPLHSLTLILASLHWYTYAVPKNMVVRCWHQTGAAKKKELRTQYTGRERIKPYVMAESLKKALFKRRDYTILAFVEAQTRHIWFSVSISFLLLFCFCCRCCCCCMVLFVLAALTIH